LKKEIVAVASEDIVSEFSTKTRRLNVQSILLTLQVPPCILFIYYATQHESELQLFVGVYAQISFLGSFMFSFFVVPKEDLKTASVDKR